MNPQDMIDELHTCFSAFDEIADRHNIEKIKTIGDAWLAVAGMPAANPLHAENIVRSCDSDQNIYGGQEGKDGRWNL